MIDFIMKKDVFFRLLCAVFFIWIFYISFFVEREGRSFFLTHIPNEVDLYINSRSCEPSDVKTIRCQLTRALFEMVFEEAGQREYLSFISRQDFAIIGAGGLTSNNWGIVFDPNLVQENGVFIDRDKVIELSSSLYGGVTEDFAIIGRDANFVSRIVHQKEDQIQIGDYSLANLRSYALSDIFYYIDSEIFGFNSKDDPIIGGVHEQNGMLRFKFASLFDVPSMRAERLLIDDRLVIRIGNMKMENLSDVLSRFYAQGFLSDLSKIPNSTDVTISFLPSSVGELNLPAVEMFFASGAPVSDVYYDSIVLMVRDTFARLYPLVEDKTLGDGTIVKELFVDSNAFPFDRTETLSEVTTKISAPFSDDSISVRYNLSKNSIEILPDDFLIMDGSNLRVDMTKMQWRCLGNHLLVDSNDEIELYPYVYINPTSYVNSQKSPIALFDFFSKFSSSMVVFNSKEAIMCLEEFAFEELSEI